MFTLKGKVEHLDERSLDVSKLLMLEISAPPTPLVHMDDGKPEAQNCQGLIHRA
jgi:hypothetical protein